LAASRASNILDALFVSQSDNVVPLPIPAPSPGTLDPKSSGFFSEYPPFPEQIDRVSLSIIID
jgi:hypothetical protein